MYFLGFLTLEYVSIVSEESDSTSCDYDHVKNLFLMCLTLMTEEVIQMFRLHRKQPAWHWREFVFELIYINICMHECKLF